MRQAAAIVLLGVTLFLQSTEAPRPFELRSAPTPAANVDGQVFRVVFRDDTTVGEERRLLASLGLEIVAGPSPRGVYTLRSTGDASAATVAEVLEQLRSAPGVRLAEPIARP